MHFPQIYFIFRFRALYNYKPQNDDEVELTEGDVVYVMEKCDDGNLNFPFFKKKYFWLFQNESSFHF